MLSSSICSSPEKSLLWVDSYLCSETSMTPLTLFQYCCIPRYYQLFYHFWLTHNLYVLHWMAYIMLMCHQATTYSFREHWDACHRVTAVLHCAHNLESTHTGDFFICVFGDNSWHWMAYIVPLSNYSLCHSVSTEMHAIMWQQCCTVHTIMSTNMDIVNGQSFLLKFSIHNTDLCIICLQWRPNRPQFATKSWLSSFLTAQREFLPQRPLGLPVTEASEPDTGSSVASMLAETKTIKYSLSELY